MIKIYKPGTYKKSDILLREMQDYSEYEKRVANIIADVKARGDAALLEYAEKFDGASLSSLCVTEEEFDEAEASVLPELIEVMKESIKNITDFHKRQLREGFRVTYDGKTLGQKITPLAKAGIYVPGGTASYPSTVIMNVIPAKIAGVKDITVATPPLKSGKIKPETLVAARLCGADRVVKCGGAGAIAALAYGTESIGRVDKITGPGNIYVALAKKLVYGVVGIDMIAGPSEILIIADETAKPEFVAADMLSQAEHDRLATAVVITDSQPLAEKIQTELYRQLSALPRKDIAEASIEANGKIIIAESLDECVDISNEIAPEHLEICTSEPFGLLDKIKNAGSIFLGNFSPEPLGDYFAGPNHTLPTSGSARFSSPLSVDDFIKKSSYIYYSEAELEKSAASIEKFAISEGLDAHARAVAIRKKERD